MIFVDAVPTDTSEEDFGYTTYRGYLEYVQADTKELFVELKENGGVNFSKVYYEDIPKLILALQAAYDFKFKGEV